MSDIRPEDWSDIQDVLRHDLEEERGDTGRLRELLATLESAPAPAPPSGAAPITDKMDPDEISRGHARIRAERSGGRAVAGAAAVIVAAGVLGLAYNALHGRKLAAGSPPVVRTARANTAPSLPPPPGVGEKLSVETPPTPTRIEGPHETAASRPRAPTRIRVADDNVEIVPTPRPAIHRTVRSDPDQIAASARKAAAARSALRRQLPKRMLIARARKSDVALGAVESTRRARTEPAGSARPAPPDSEYSAPKPVVRTGPETASFTPMIKARVLPEPRSPSRDSRADDYPESRPTPRIARGNYDDRPDEDRWPSFERERPRERSISREPLVRRRICVETGLLASDLCPHTAIVLVPESRAPRRLCRVHALP